MKIGFFPMVADMLHAGHCIAIEEAKKHCDYLIIGLLCNPTHKGKRMPVQSTYERYMQLRAVKWVDEIIPYDAEVSDIELLLRSLQFDIYFLGEDYRNADFPGKEILTERGKDIFYVPRKHIISTTELIGRAYTSYSNIKEENK